MSTSLQVNLSRLKEFWLSFNKEDIISSSRDGSPSNPMCFCCPVFTADGSSDDIDQPLRRLFADQELVKSYGLMSLNSVNWSRVMIQLAHFIYAYLQLSGMDQTEADSALPELEVVVPTGGAGNIAGSFSTTDLYDRSDHSIHNSSTPNL